MFLRPPGAFPLRSTAPAGAPGSTVSPRTLLAAALVLCVAGHPPATAATGKERVVVAEASYTMSDHDTLAGAEEKVLLRAKRRAVEEAGVYLETTSEHQESVGKDGRSAQSSSLGVRSLAAAVTETRILESRRWLEHDRVVFYVKIQATVHVNWLEETARRLKADDRLAEHHRTLHNEHRQLKAELSRLHQQLKQAPGHRDVPSSRKPRREAADLVRKAVQARDLSRKIALASAAIDADPSFTEGYVIRGQTYLRIASLAAARASRASKDEKKEIERYVEQSIADFNAALTHEPGSAWALLGRGDAYTWKKRLVEAAQDYEHILQLDPLFDLARQRLISVYTSVAKKQAAGRRWHDALQTLGRILPTGAEPSLGWTAYQKDAYLLRSRVYEALGQLERATADLSTVLLVDPGNVHAYLQRGTLYRKQSQGRLAAEDFERACLLGAEHACAPGGPADGAAR